MDPPFPEIELLLPHRGRMRLVEAIVSLTETDAVSIATVRESWPLHDGGYVEPIVLIELLAQTSGLCNGLTRLRDEGIDSDKSGWIVGIKEAHLFVNALPVGTTIVSSAENRFTFDDFREVHGAARIGDTVVADAVLQLMRAKTAF